MKTAIAFFCCVASTLAFGQDASPCAQASVFVRDFRAQSTESGSSRVIGSRLRAARNSVKVDQNASSLAQGIVKALNAKGVASCRIASDAALPQTGWLVSGEFDQALPSGIGAALPSAGSSEKNTHVTVRLARLAAGADSAASAAAVLHADDTLKGQKPPAVPNPYAAAARFVIGHVEAMSSIDELAGSIADGIFEQKAKLDAGTQ